MTRPKETGVDFRAIVNATMKAADMSRTELARRLAKYPERHRTSLAQLRFYLNGYQSLSADRLEGIFAVLGLKVC